MKNPHHTYWVQTRKLALFVLAMIGLFCLLLPFVGLLGGFSFFGFSFDFYMIMQGAILSFIGFIFWHSVRQERIDKAHRVTEDI